MYILTCCVSVCTYMLCKCIYLHVVEVYVLTCGISVCTYMLCKCMYLQVV